MNLDEVLEPNASVALDAMMLGATDATFAGGHSSHDSAPPLACVPARPAVPGYTEAEVRAYFDQHTQPFTSVLRDKYGTYKYLKEREQKRLPTHTTISSLGGTYCVTEPYMLYLEVADDYQAGRVYPLNEMTTTVDKSVSLCFELDFEFPNGTAVPADLAQFLEPILGTLHSTVQTHVKPKHVDNVYAVVLTSPVKPKYKSQDQVYRAHLGVHVIYNLFVTIHDGAQLSMAVKSALRASFPDNLEYAEAVDCRYFAGTSYRKIVSLRPPFSAKEIDCYTCSRPQWRAQERQQQAATLPGTEGLRRLNKRPHEETTGTLCPKCQGRGKVIDVHAIYTLWGVFDLQNERKPELERQLRQDPAKLMLASSVKPHNKIELVVATPEFSLPEIRQAQPQRQPQPAPSAKLQKAKARSFSAYHVCHDLNLPYRRSIGTVLLTPGKAPPHFRMADLRKLQDNLTTLTQRLHREYQDTTSTDIKWWAGAVLTWSVSNRMRIPQLNGKVWCMASNAANTSNRALFMLLDVHGEVRLFAGCYNDHGPDVPMYVPVTHVDHVQTADIIKSVKEIISRNAIAPML